MKYTLWIMQKVFRFCFKYIWIDEGWNVISALKQLDGRQIITVKFDTITSEKFKVKFTKRIRSENGFDIPNILYMRVFKDNASR